MGTEAREAKTSGEIRSMHVSLGLIRTLAREALDATLLDIWNKETYEPELWKTAESIEVELAYLDGVLDGLSWVTGWKSWETIKADRPRIAVKDLASRASSLPKTVERYGAGTKAQADRIRQLEKALDDVNARHQAQQEEILDAVNRADARVKNLRLQYDLLVDELAAYKTKNKGVDTLD